MIRHLTMICGSVLFLLCCETASAQTQLFLDDFSGSVLDSSKWNVADWTFGGNRTYFGNTPSISGGIASFQLDTYNAAHPGSYFSGTEIYSTQTYSRGNGLELDARVRTNAMPGGLVTSFFTYTTNADSTADEIDFEALTNEINANPIPPGTGQPIQLTTWHNWDNNPSHYGDGIHHYSVTPTVPGLNLNDFNTYSIRWLPDHTEWLINGTLIYSTDKALAASPTNIHLNFWAPDSGWTDAYNPNLQPTSNPNLNQSFYYDVDYVAVYSVPEPTSLSLFLAGGVLVSWFFGLRKSHDL